MSDDSLELLRGTLDLLILRALARERMHGYGVSAWLRQRTDGTLVVQDAALYQALRRLERRGWVEAEWGHSENNRRARYYALTSRGRQQFEAKSAVWSRYAEAVFKVLAPAPGDVR